MAEQNIFSEAVKYARTKKLHANLSQYSPRRFTMLDEIGMFLRIGWTRLFPDLNQLARLERLVQGNKIRKHFVDLEHPKVKTMLDILGYASKPEEDAQVKGKTFGHYLPGGKVWVFEREGTTPLREGKSIDEFAAIYSDKDKNTMVIGKNEGTVFKSVYDLVRAAYYSEEQEFDAVISEAPLVGEDALYSLILEYDKNC